MHITIKILVCQWRNEAGDAGGKRRNEATKQRSNEVMKQRSNEVTTEKEKGKKKEPGRKKALRGKPESRKS
jgi:hypothetical protein